MRAALLAITLAATPAAAEGIPSALRWSLDSHALDGGRSLDAVLTAERVGMGWRLTLMCETTDVSVGRVVARERHEGVGVRHPAVPYLVMGMMDGGASQVTLGFPGDRPPTLMTSYPGCPIGQANLDTDH